MNIPEGPSLVLWQLSVNIYKAFNTVLGLWEVLKKCHLLVLVLLTITFIVKTIFILVSNCRISPPSIYIFYSILGEIMYSISLRPHSRRWWQGECSLPWPEHGDWATGFWESPTRISLPRYFSHLFRLNFILLLASMTPKHWPICPPFPCHHQWFL